MLFSFTDALAIFQNFIYDVLAAYLDRFCMEYLNNMLIYSDTFEEHQAHINLLLEAFEKAGLYLTLENYNFHC
jgi:hypothetical protein